MSELQPWIERVFEFDLAVEQHTELVQRLARTPDRLEELTGSLRAEQLVARLEGVWSIQENVGHLLDLEMLFMGDWTITRQAWMSCVPLTCRIEQRTRRVTTIVTSMNW